MMIAYDVCLDCGVYGLVKTGGKANTPYDAFDKCFTRLTWRWKAEFKGAEVMIMDGSKKT